MEHINIDISSIPKGYYHTEIPAVCAPIFENIVKEMSVLIEDEDIREIFYSLSLGHDMQEISKKTGVALKRLAYMYRKGSQIVCTNWKPIQQSERELQHALIKCRNYESLLNIPQAIIRLNSKSLVLVVRDQDIPTEYVKLLTTPLEKLDISLRTLRVLRKYNIYLLEDLLRFIKLNGFEALKRLQGMGDRSVEQLYEKLKAKNIFESENTCGLFRYLFV